MLVHYLISFQIASLHFFFFAFLVKNTSGILLKKNNIPEVFLTKKAKNMNHGSPLFPTIYLYMYIYARNWASTDAASSSTSNNKQQSQQCSRVSAASSTQLRIILSILYTMVETLRWACPSATEKELAAREAFIAELGVVSEII